MLRDPLTYMAKEMAGFTWAPDSLPMSRIITASVKPTTYALPPEAKTDSTSKKVPRNSPNSATKSTISSTRA